MNRGNTDGLDDVSIVYCDDLLGKRDVRTVVSRDVRTDVSRDVRTEVSRNAYVDVYRDIVRYNWCLESHRYHESWEY